MQWRQLVKDMEAWNRIVMNLVRALGVNADTEDLNVLTCILSCQTQELSSLAVAQAV